MFFNIVIIILIILIIMVKPAAASKASKKQRTSVSEITHESVENVKSNMDRHTYSVRVRDADFFNGQRGIEDSFQMVIHEVVDTVLRDLEYDSSCMRVGINFTFNDGAPRSQQYFVNIRWRDVAASNAVPEMMRRLEGSFQSGDKATFSKFKVVATVFRMAKGNGKMKMPNTHVLTPMNLSFDHPHIPKGHLKEGPTGCAFRAVILYKKTVRQGLNACDIWGSTIEDAAIALANACKIKYTAPFIATDFEKIEKVEKCRIIVFAGEGSECKNHL
ncbi:hypothetical protein Avbf_18658 [Armadillidium vulgare]|nr:hypothetical protein Avbf_18658 [Armadillidium vulgare]